jgi:hypothetical protein
VATSALFTTLVGLALAAAGVFSLPRMALLGGIATLLGYLLVARVRDEEPGAGVRTGLGPAAFALALCLYWPPFETHFAASDSTAYTAAGVHLARSHRLWKLDTFGDELGPLLRARLFFSVLGHPWKPPYARMPGGLVIDTPQSNVVRPSFFPAPVVWAALSADALGARRAGAFAPLFAALAVWAFWHFARRRLSAVPAALATALVALNAACYWAGRFPLAEPLAWFFLWAGLVALDAYEEDGFAADARLAGAMLGAAGLVRLEYLAFVAAALSLRYLLRSTIASRPLTPGFAAGLGALGLAAVAEVELLPGSYVSPIRDAVDGLRYPFLVWWDATSRAVTIATIAAALAAALGAAVFAVRRIGSPRLLALATLAAVVGGYVLTSHSTTMRSLLWLWNYVGPFTLIAGAAGAMLVWRERHALPGDGFFVVLALLVTALLVFSPHVYPAMPWASRRYVPLVIPALLVFAVSAVVKLRARSSTAAILAGAALVASVALPARATWRLPSYEGTYDELHRLAEQLPRNGTLLIDNRLIGLLLATPLWLGFDLNTLPVDMSTVEGRRYTAAAVYSVRERGPVFVLKPSRSPTEPLPLVRSRPLKDFEIEIALPEQTAGPPRRLERYVELVSLFALEPFPAPATPSAQSR